MTYVSLYRKWRPQTFSQLVGQDHIARTLANSIKADRVAHAYLFAGPRGTGKTSTAKILAKSVNCGAGPTPEPCGQCESCRTIVAGTSLDVFEMDAASNRGIDEIRDLRDKVAYAAAAGRRKVYIIDEVHMLTEPAFNALLKTLEEPPAHVIFILATTDPNKVPVTISSRCQHFEFRRIPSPALVDHLVKISKAEKIAVDADVLTIIARQSEGSLRDAIGMLDQLAAYSDKKITKEEATKFLGLIDAAVVEACVDLVMAGAGGPVFEFVDSLAEVGRDFRQFTAALLAYLRDLFVLAQVRGIERQRQLVNAGDETIAVMVKKAEFLGAPKIRSFLTEVSRLYENLRTAADQRLSLELTLLGLMRNEELTLEAVSSRLQRLEAGAGHISSGAVAASPAEKTKSTAAPVKSVSKTRAEADGPIDITQVTAAWGDIVNRAKKKKLSLGAYLIEGRPKGVNDGCLMIAFEHKSTFACQELVKEPHAKLLKEVFVEALGGSLDFTVVLSEGAADGAAPAEPAPDERNVLDMIKESFGAEVVDG
ncbi:MAG: DNA polymerase III subunit gamma/tau [Actinomycetota bacterium]|nr:DNA polymerase III subunit gamma/tau [Actinomycetota bacterium]